VMMTFPTTTLAWCNQHVWQESSNGSWQDTHSLVNPEDHSDAAPRLIHWGRLRQVMGGEHANGAMLMRSRPGQNYTTPDIPFAGVESYRERMVPHPMVYVPQPLAFFARTLQTARANAFADWGAFQVTLAATFLRHCAQKDTQFREIWNHFKHQQQPMTNELIAAGLVCREARPLLRLAGFGDWFHFLVNAGRHPLSTLHKLRLRTEHPDWWNLLDRQTAARFAKTAPKSPAQHPSPP